MTLFCYFLQKICDLDTVPPKKISHMKIRSLAYQQMMQIPIMSVLLLRFLILELQSFSSHPKPHF